MIRDQRTMTPGRGLRTAADVRAAWKRESNRGFEERDGAVGLLDARALPPLTAYVNHGRWLADCAACTGAVAGWPEHEYGCCLSCGRVWTITYPSDAGTVETLLEPRPTANRNYDPRKGETVDMLVRENELFLIHSPAALSAFDAVVLDGGTGDLSAAVREQLPVRKVESEHG